MSDEERKLRIVVNSGAKMSRGKYAAAAVHAALLAVGAHPGTPVIVLGGKRDEIEAMATVVRDAGHTEVDPGTVTAGTDWKSSILMSLTAEDYMALAEKMREKIIEELDAEYVISKRRAVLRKSNPEGKLSRVVKANTGRVT